MKLSALVSSGVLLAADAFNVQPQGGGQQVSRRSFGEAFGAFTVASIVAGGNEPASAFDGPSVTVADAVTTMDLSLPSSYDSISTSKAKVDTLTQEYKPEVDAPAVKARKKKEPKEKATNGGGGAGSFLPSMSKSTTKSPKPKPAPKPKPERKEKEGPVTNVETMDLSLPSYSSTTKEKNMFAL